jgi:hypothetical protein
MSRVAVPRRIVTEVSLWPGAAIVRFEQGGKHHKLTLRYDERERFITLSSTASNRRAIERQLGDVRRTLADLGAVRNGRSKGTKQRIRNRPDRPALASIERAPVKENPFEALTAVRFAESQPRQSWLKRFIAWLASRVAVA